MICPISTCCVAVPGALRICKTHYRLVPRPQQEALGSFARRHKGGPAHRAAFARAVESVEAVLAARTRSGLDALALGVALPYRDD